MSEIECPHCSQSLKQSMKSKLTRVRKLDCHHCNQSFVAILVGKSVSRFWFNPSKMEVK